MLGFVIAAGSGLEYAIEPDTTELDAYNPLTLNTGGDRSEEARARLNTVLDIKAPGFEVVVVDGNWYLKRPNNTPEGSCLVPYYDGMWV